MDGALDRPPGAAPRSGRGFSPGQSNAGQLVLGCVVPRALRPVGPLLYRCWVLASFSYLWRFGYSWSVSPSFTLPLYTIIERIRIYTCALARAARAVRSSEHTCAVFSCLANVSRTHQCSPCVPSFRASRLVMRRRSHCLRPCRLCSTSCSWWLALPPASRSAPPVGGCCAS